MNKAQVDYAERKALQLFDQWNEATGVFDPPCFGYYNEVAGCIEDAVHCGIQMALNGKIMVEDGRVVVGDNLTDHQDAAEWSPSADEKRAMDGLKLIRDVLCGIAPVQEGVVEACLAIVDRALAGDKVVYEEPRL